MSLGSLATLATLLPRLSEQHSSKNAEALPCGFTAARTPRASRPPFLARPECCTKAMGCDDTRKEALRVPTTLAPGGRLRTALTALVAAAAAAAAAAVATASAAASCHGALNGALRGAAKHRMPATVRSTGGGGGRSLTMRTLAEVAWPTVMPPLRARRTAAVAWALEASSQRTEASHPDVPAHDGGRHGLARRRPRAQVLRQEGPQGLQGRWLRSVVRAQGDGATRQLGPLRPSPEAAWPAQQSPGSAPLAWSIRGRAARSARWRA